MFALISLSVTPLLFRENSIFVIYSFISTVLRVRFRGISSFLWVFLISLKSKMKPDNFKRKWNTIEPNPYIFLFIEKYSLMIYHWKWSLNVWFCGFKLKLQMFLKISSWRNKISIIQASISILISSFVKIIIMIIMDDNEIKGKDKRGLICI